MTSATHNDPIELRRRPESAEDWAARMHASDVSGRDRSEFYAWINADPANADAYAECEALWVVSKRARPDHRVHMPRRNVARWALAASVVVASVVVAFLAFDMTAERTLTSTRKGEQRTIALADGSRIELNTDTQVSYRLTDRERRVVLKHGEAFFDVARDMQRPFIVEVGKSEVRVLGTQFTVRQEGDRLQVVVKEGKVSVIPDARGLSPASSKNNVELTRGALLRFEPEPQRIQVAVVDIERELAWRTGSVDFDSDTLEQVVAELNRYAEKPFIIDDPSIRELPVTGRVRVNDLASIRYMLRESFNVETITRADGIGLRKGQQ